MRILIADDEGIIRLGLAATLEDMGHEVVAAVPDGVQAVEMARATQPDMVILDIKMPGLDGLDAAEAITAERPVPVIILTAYSNPGLVARAASLAVHAYLTKPVRPVDLAPALEIAVARFDETQALRREAADLQSAMRILQVLEEAKRVLMSERGLREAEASHYLQAKALRERRSIRDVCEEVLHGSGCG
ncbi:MAG: response regulator [Anaerolineae bacterium]|nr:response regulator [Anaerolineae bacterium]